MFSLVECRETVLVYQQVLNACSIYFILWVLYHFTSNVNVVPCNTYLHTIIVLFVDVIKCP
jgi:hypothetical protein